MSVSQLSVFVENKAGRVAEVMRLVADQGLKVVGFTIADTIDYGIARLVVDRSDDAAAALREQGFTIVDNQVVCVETGEAGADLASLVGLLSSSGINVEYMYLTTRHAAIVKVEDCRETERLLRENGFGVLDGEDLLAMGQC